LLTELADVVGAQIYLILAAAELEPHGLIRWATIQRDSCRRTQVEPTNGA
jgi:hypothetical protein